MQRFRVRPDTVPYCLILDQGLHSSPHRAFPPLPSQARLRPIVKQQSTGL